VSRSKFFLSEHDIGDLCDLAEAWLKTEPCVPCATHMRMLQKRS
jgi:hypothetical protein